MTRFVALLRGINVGGAKLVPMAELRGLLEKLGHSNVKTLLNSGNAVFSSNSRSTNKLAAGIAAAIEKKFGFEVHVIVKSQRELSAIEAENALAKAATDHSRLLIAFAAEPQQFKDLDVMLPQVKSPEKALLGKHALYLWCANGILESKAAATLLGKAGRQLTTRNWATVQKISGLLASE